MSGVKGAQNVSVPDSWVYYASDMQCIKEVLLAGISDGKEFGIGDSGRKRSGNPGLRKLAMILVEMVGPETPVTAKMLSIIAQCNMSTASAVMKSLVGEGLLEVVGKHVNSWSYCVNRDMLRESAVGKSYAELAHRHHIRSGDVRFATARGKRGRVGRPAVLIEANGESLTAAEWEARTGVPRATIHKRIQAGWDIERVLTEPVHTRNRPSKENSHGRGSTPPQGRGVPA